MYFETPIGFGPNFPPNPETGSHFEYGHWSSLLRNRNNGLPSKIKPKLVNHNNKATAVTSGVRKCQILALATDQAEEAGKEKFVVGFLKNLKRLLHAHSCPFLLQHNIEAVHELNPRIE